MRRGLPGVIDPYAVHRRFVQIADKVITGTLLETSILGEGIGELAILGRNIKVGSTLRYKAFGMITTPAAPGSAELNIKIGSTNIVHSTQTPPANKTDCVVEIEFLATVRSIGVNSTLCGQGFTIVKAPNTTDAGTLRLLTEVEGITFDSTIANTIDITYKPGSADLSLTIREAVIEIIQ